MTTKAVRGVTDEEWVRIKAVASRRGMPIGRFLVRTVEEAMENGNMKAWERILSVKPDPKLAAEIEKGVKEFRKGFRLREFK